VCACVRVCVCVCELINVCSDKLLEQNSFLSVL